MKKYTKISLQWFYNLLEKGECDFVDFKEQLEDKKYFGKSIQSFAPNYKEIARDVVSFANHKGGFIIVGITDITRSPIVTIPGKHLLKLGNTIIILNLKALADFQMESQLKIIFVNLTLAIQILWMYFEKLNLRKKPEVGLIKYLQRYLQKGSPFQCQKSPTAVQFSKYQEMHWPNPSFN